MADIPPPPNNPFGEQNEPEDFSPSSEGLAQNRPSVAAKPGKGLMVVGIVGGVLLLLIYNLFFSGSKEKVVEKPKERSVAAPITPPPLPKEPVVPVTPVTPLPITPPPTLTPPAVPQPAITNLLKPEDDAAAKAQAQARMRSKVLVQGGGDGGLLSGAAPSVSSTPKDGNSAFESSIVAANTKAPQVQATHLGNLRRTIAQGRIIQATMESALNTELPAPIRAIVSRDVYGEAGTEPLIPKGSRLIGSYNTEILGGQSRVFVVWTRVIRPDGVDVMLGSPLVDQIGQAGIGGQVDTKFQQIFSRSVLASIMNIAFAIGAEKASGNETSTTSTSGGGTTTTQSASTEATTNALNRLGATTDAFIQRFINARTTILVDQGTKVNVFVNRDLVFPDDLTGARVIY